MVNSEMENLRFRFIFAIDAMWHSGEFKTAQTVQFCSNISKTVDQGGVGLETSPSQSSGSPLCTVINVTLYW